MNETGVLREFCPACGAAVDVPTTGEWVACPQPHCRGRLRWTSENDAAETRQLRDAERIHLLRLRGELAELDRWVRESVPGASRLAKQIREQLRSLAGEEKDRKP